MFPMMPRHDAVGVRFMSVLVRWASGLGEIHLNSALNEPLRAEIDLVAASPDEVGRAAREPGPRDAFTRYGIDRAAFLSSWPSRSARARMVATCCWCTSTDSIPEALHHVLGRGQLGARPPDARIHLVARPAGLQSRVRHRTTRRPGCRGDAGTRPCPRVSACAHADAERPGACAAERGSRDCRRAARRGRRRFLSWSRPGTR